MMLVLLNSSLYLSHALYNDSPSYYSKVVISFLKHVVFVIGKYLATKFCAKLFHLVTKPGGKKFNYVFALSHSEKGQILNRIALSLTLLIFKVSHISKKILIYACGSSFKWPSKWMDIYDEGQLNLEVICYYRSHNMRNMFPLRMGVT